MNTLTSTGYTNVNIGASTNLELVDKFCHLGNMLSVDRDTDAAADARIQTGWNKLLSAYQYRYIIDYERETVQQLCE